MAHADPERSPPTARGEPTITIDQATPQLIVTDHGFLPRRGVKIRVLGPDS